MLSRETHTPVTYWLDLPIVELDEWYDETISFLKMLHSKG